MKELRYIPGVVTLTFDESRCTGCGVCVVVCPHRVFGMNGNRAYIKERDSCMECGACMKNCPAGAILVKPGVGCAYAVIIGMIKGTEPDCGCSSSCCD